jgi:hypothetical protein
MRDYQRAKELAELYKGYVTAVATERAGLAISFPGIEVLGVTAAAAGAAAAAAAAPAKAAAKAEEMAKMPTGYTLTGRIILNISRNPCRWTDIVGIGLTAQVKAVNKVVYDWDTANVALQKPVVYIDGKANSLPEPKGILGLGQMAKASMAWKPPFWPEEKSYTVKGEGGVYYSTSVGTYSSHLTTDEVKLVVQKPSDVEIKAQEDTYRRMGYKSPPWGKWYTS